MMVVYEFEEFMRECFGEYVKPTYEKFKNEAVLDYTANKLTLRQFADKLDDDDIRKKDFDGWISTLYNSYIENFEFMLKKWFDAHISVYDSAKYLRYNVEPSKYKIDDGLIIDGKKNITYGRLVRNLNFDGIYKNTGKINSSEKVSTLTLFNMLLDNKIGATVLIIPITHKFLLSGDYSGVFAMLRGTTNKASVFNPYTYSWILKNVFPKGKKLFSPVLSWCSPVIGIANSNYTEMVAVDVIPEVVERAKKLHEYSESMRNPFFDDDTKTAKFYCCPSEKLDERHNFSNEYSEYFDLVFFSPPYYNLELYSGGEQSHETFDTYESWLNGYWRKTVELCYKCLKPGATFSFVIVPEYPDGKDRLSISTDMKKVAEEYFTPQKTLNISWGGFSASESSTEKRQSIVEDLHIMRKV